MAANLDYMGKAEETGQTEAPEQVTVTRTINVCGLDKRQLWEKLGTLLHSLNPAVKIIPGFGEAAVRVTARADTQEQALARCEPMVDKICGALGEAVYGLDARGELPNMVFDALRRKRRSLSSGESSTGGRLAFLLKSVPDTDRSLRFTVTASLDRVKQESLGVSDKVLRKYGPVSSQVAIAMAVGAMNRGNSSMGLAITGAVSENGKPLTETGHFFIALCSRDTVWFRELSFSGESDPESMKSAACLSALNLVRLCLCAPLGAFSGAMPLMTDAMEKEREAKRRRLKMVIASSLLVFLGSVSYLAFHFAGITSSEKPVLPTEAPSVSESISSAPKKQPSSTSQAPALVKEAEEAAGQAASACDAAEQALETAKKADSSDDVHTAAKEATEAVRKAQKAYDQARKAMEQAEELCQEAPDDDAAQAIYDAVLQQALDTRESYKDTRDCADDIQVIQLSLETSVSAAPEPAPSEVVSSAPQTNPAPSSPASINAAELAASQAAASQAAASKAASDAAASLAAVSKAAEEEAASKAAAASSKAAAAARASSRAASRAEASRKAAEEAAREEEEMIWGDDDDDGELLDPVVSQKEESSSHSGSSDSSSQKLTIVAGGKKVSGSASEVVAKVVMNEMGSSFETEALKAQAVAAYTYILNQNASGTTPSLGVKTPNSKVQNAVDAVIGEAVYYRGGLAFTPFFATSAGVTVSSKDVWGGSYSYLVPVDSDVDERARNFAVTVEMSAEDVADRVDRALGFDLYDYSDDPDDWFEIESHTDGDRYVKSVRVGKRTTTGRILREQVLGLRSAAFEIDYDSSEEAFTFTTYGYGHGVGMSQTGANFYALDGWDYQEILTHYYPGTSVE